MLLNLCIFSQIYAYVFNGNWPLFFEFDWKMSEEIYDICTFLYNLFFQTKPVDINYWLKMSNQLGFSIMLIEIFILNIQSCNYVLKVAAKCVQNLGSA